VQIAREVIFTLSKGRQIFQVRIPLDEVMTLRVELIEDTPLDLPHGMLFLETVWVWFSNLAMEFPRRRAFSVLPESANLESRFSVFYTVHTPL